MKKQNFEIAVAKSNIDWIGRKITGFHFGTIGIKKGTLTVTDGELTAGKFIIDTTSIKILDVADPALNKQFAGHLASDDFFSSAQYPEAIYEITAVSNNHIDGNLTIKGITHPVGFAASISISEESLNASGMVQVDRTKYNMRFRSGNFFQNLGDNLIYDNFELTVNITAVAAVEVALA